ncbi:DUF6404 family protein [Pseudoduganella guangdongensis]|uniref:DUF6404 family protein n=1 Tax=Pseudoduganella guangdongensis TaxID=2692179 RepID=UPI003530AF4A
MADCLVACDCGPVNGLSGEAGGRELGLWRLGIDLAPPHFASFWQNFLVVGSYYTVMWGGPMWLLHWSKDGASFNTGLAYAIFAGAVFGGVIAASYERAKRRNGLPAWRDLGRS